jgi:hypothetical protein
MKFSQLQQLNRYRSLHSRMPDYSVSQIARAVDSRLVEIRLRLVRRSSYWIGRHRNLAHGVTTSELNLFKCKVHPVGDTER